MKYELTNETKVFAGRTLHRIKRISDGLLGGWIENESNLSQDGNCFVYGEAMVYGNAGIFRDAWISGDAKIFGNARVFGNAWISGDANVYGDAKILDNARVYDNANICGDVSIIGRANVFEHAIIRGNANVCGDEMVCGYALIESDNDIASIRGFGRINRTTTFFRCLDGEIRTTCGCFYGTIAEFKKQVKKTHEGFIAEEYLIISDLMEKRFKKRNYKSVSVISVSNGEYIVKNDI